MFDQARYYFDSANEAERLGKLDSACALYKAALQQQPPIREHMTFNILKSLGRIYLHQRRFKKAETNYRQMLAKLRRNQSELKWHKRYVLLKLAEVCISNKKYRSAERYFTEGLAEFGSTVRHDDAADCLPALKNLASMWSSRSRSDLANLALDAMRRETIAESQDKLAASNNSSTGE